jgi:predicted metalloprotease with PDZ domain
VAPFDWEQFLQQRVHGNAAPLDGLTRGGWRLVYGDIRTEHLRSLEEWRGVADFIFSVGLSVGQAGEVSEVRWGSAAYQAGLTLGTTLVAVNGREYHPDRLREAIAAAHAEHMPIELIVKNLDRYRVIKIPYYDGLKYPRLERIGGSVDRLTAIEQPRTP